MLDKRVRAGAYPRKTVRNDVSTCRLKVLALAERGRVDVIIIRRCGKDRWVSVHPEHFNMLEELKPVPTRRGRRTGKSLRRAPARV